MKRTEKKLRSKGIKAHSPSPAHAYSWQKYDRNYVTRNHGEVRKLSLSRGCYRIWSSRFDHLNGRLCNYLKRFFRKQVGKKADVVFHEFKKLGWKSSYEMYDYWRWFISPGVRIRRDAFCLSDEGVLLQVDKLSSPKG